MERENREVALRDSRVHFIDLSEADGYVHTEQSVITASLRSRNHLSQDFIYSAFNIQGIQRLLQTGTYRVKEDPNYDVVFCCQLKRGKGRSTTIESYSEGYDLVHYLTLRAEGEKDAAFVVFKANAFVSVALEQYEFKNPNSKKEALVAVYVIEDYFVC